MKLLVVLAIAVSVAAAAEVFRGAPELDNQWKAYKEKHGKKYNHGAHEASRRKNWEKTRAKIDKHNKEAAAGLHSFTLDENDYSDLDETERKVLNGARLTENAQDLLSGQVEPDLLITQAVKIPSSVDLRTNNCMPPIEDQGYCGSCWAFAATGALDYALCKKNGKRYTLSEQQLVDCSGDYYNYGCNGGMYYGAWNYVKANGQTTLSVYPYTATTETCKYSNATSVGTVTGQIRIPARNETAIRKAVATNGAVSAALLVIDSFFDYSSGIYADAACPNDGSINHAVMIVGYGTTNQTDYWIIRNSWGTTWGQKGYMKIKRGVNMCSIESYVAYPTV